MRDMHLERRITPTITSHVLFAKHACIIFPHHALVKTKTSRMKLCIQTRLTSWLTTPRLTRLAPIAHC